MCVGKAGAPSSRGLWKSEELQAFVCLLAVDQGGLAMVLGLGNLGLAVVLSAGILWAGGGVLKSGIDSLLCLWWGLVFSILIILQSISRVNIDLGSSK